MNGFSFNVNTIGIQNVRTAPRNLQHIKDLKRTEWSVETCSPIISGNKCCADVNNWLTLWRRNYFFLNFSTPYIQNVNNAGTKQVSIMKQTAFWRERNGEYRACWKYSVPVFVE